MSEHKNPFRSTDPFKKDRNLIYKHIGLTKKITRYYQYSVILILISYIFFKQLHRLYKYITFKLYPAASLPLIRRHNARQNRRMIVLQSFLISKPAILSSLFQDNKTMIITSIYYLINAFVFLYKLPMDDSFNLALRSGLVSGTNIPLLYMIPLKSGPLLYLLDESYENMLVYHKFIGILVVLMAGIHTLTFCYCLTWEYLLNSSYGITGAIIISCFLLLAITSTALVRTKWYEMFYFMHLLSFVVFLPFFYKHHYVCKPFVIFVVGCLSFDRVVRWCFKSWLFECQVLTLDPQDEMMIVSINTDISQLSLWQKFISLVLFKPSGSRFKWEVSNHLFLNIPKIHPWQSHPFTIANTPDEKNPILIIKIHTGFTNQLFKYSQTHQKFTCFIHGPYGNSAKHFPETTTPDHDALLEIPIPYHIISHESTPLIPSSVKKRSPSGTNVTVNNTSSFSSISSFSNILRQKIILIAGGAGVSFTLPLLSIYHRNPAYDVSFIWIIRNEKPLRQIKFDRRDELIIWCTSLKGRPDVQNLLFDTLGDEHFAMINIMACGPNGLINDIKDFTKEKIKKGTEINLITEEFTF